MVVWMSLNCKKFVRYGIAMRTNKYVENKNNNNSSSHTKRSIDFEKYALVYVRSSFHTNWF